MWRKRGRRLKKQHLEDAEEGDIHSRYAPRDFSCVHPRCNTAASGKRMNSAAAGEAKDFMWSAHVALHNFPEFAVQSPLQGGQTPLPSRCSL